MSICCRFILSLSTTNTVNCRNLSDTMVCRKICHIILWIWTVKKLVSFCFAISLSPALTPHPNFALFSNLHWFWRFFVLLYLAFKIISFIGCQKLSYKSFFWVETFEKIKLPPYLKFLLPPLVMAYYSILVIHVIRNYAVKIIPLNRSGCWKRIPYSSTVLWWEKYY